MATANDAFGPDVVGPMRSGALLKRCPWRRQTRSLSSPVLLALGKRLQPKLWQRCRVRPKCSFTRTTFGTSVSREPSLRFRSRRTRRATLQSTCWLKRRTVARRAVTLLSWMASSRTHSLVVPKIDVESAVARCQARGGDTLTDPQAIASLHKQLSLLDEWNNHELDIRGHSPECTLAAVAAATKSKAYLLHDGVAGIHANSAG